MKLGYFLLLITLKNINCYNPKRHTQSSSTSNLKSKTSDPVIPARYKVTSKTNYDDPATLSFPPEYFPEVEYPESIVDSSKPFYLSASPFPDDVKSAFNSLVAKKNNKSKIKTDYSWIHNENQDENNIEKISATSQKLGVNEATVTKGNEINSNDKITNETLHKYITILDFEDDTSSNGIPYSNTDMDKLFTNWSSTELSTKYDEDADYVIGFINELDEFMKNLTTIETLGHNAGNYSTAHAFQSECSNKFKLINSDMTPKNNETIIEFNGNSFLTGKHPEQIRNTLLENSDTNDELTSLTLLLNEYVTNTSSAEDMQSEFCSIGTIANETNTPCTDS